MAIDYVNREGLEHFHENLKTYLSTKYATKEELEAAIANFGGFQVVSLNQQGKPDVAEPSTKIIYLTKESGSSKTDPYTEWICTNTTGPVWEIIGETTPEINEMIGATASTAGTAGLVPAPQAGDQGKVLTGDGNWSEVEEYTDAYIDSLPWMTGPSVVIGGREYPVVQIGNQLWLAENLDWKFDGLTVGGQWQTETPGAWYYNNDETTYGVNGNKYGLLYNSAAVIALLTTVNLPEGWKIPSSTDWRTLVSTVTTTGTGPTNNNAGVKLRSVSANGTDDYGMSIPCAGFVNWNGTFNSVNTYCSMWNGYVAVSPLLGYSMTTSSVDYFNPNVGASGNGNSIRLCKNLT